MELGVCYYPEHWPRSAWREDARRMRALGLSFARIGEFAWSRLEPEPGRYCFDWLDEAFDVLTREGLEICLGTPTATPPKWLIDAHPEILAQGVDGRVRGFGSRRHYCFSSPVYRAASATIVEAVAARYGRRPGLKAWQVDNEYGCHNTVVSASPAAAAGFRRWLEARYGDIGALNRAWGTVFWSQEYRAFEEVDPPFGTVTEPHPAHSLDYRRFASDEVIAFHAVQTEIIRRLSPGREITHNFMGFFTDFDHFALGRDLDFASWDSYPLGFLEDFWFDAELKRRYLSRGHPDISAFHHDLYRGCGRGRFWVMEQQPGPVNWARFNPAPADGMVRTWTLEAAAHGAEAVSYFRWRQLPFGQEQMHAGLNRPDGRLDQGGEEAAAAAADLRRLGPLPAAGRARAALIFCYDTDWACQIQPHGRGYRWLELAFEAYSVLRRLGLDVDIVEPGEDLQAYDLVVAPALAAPRDVDVQALEAFKGVLVLGPRSGSRTREGQIPPNLPPGRLHDLVGGAVLRVESLRPGAEPPVVMGPHKGRGRLWRERLETTAQTLASFDDGAPAVTRNANVVYLATWLEVPLLETLLASLAMEKGLNVQPLDPDVRLRRRGDLVFAFNFGPEARPTPSPPEAAYVIGGPTLPPGGVAIWR